MAKSKQDKLDKLINEKFTAFAKTIEKIADPVARAQVVGNSIAILARSFSTSSMEALGFLDIANDAVKELAKKHKEGGGAEEIRRASGKTGYN